MKAKTTNGGEIDLGPEVLGALRMRLKGPVLGSGDAGYEDSRTVWNGTISKKPALVQPEARVQTG